MQLRLAIVCLMLLSLQAFAQQDSTRKRRIGPVQVDIISTYYSQDGNNSPVTGGKGTEELTDIANKIILIVPTDSVTTLSVNAHFNHYSSASTDRINSVLSSASAVDSRFQIDMGYQRYIPKKNMSFGANAGSSIESDLISYFGGINWWRSFRSDNIRLAVRGGVYMDTWVVIFKEELRDIGQQYIKTDKRRSYDLSFNYTQVLNRRAQAQLSVDFVYQHGLLSTPFHSVYFTDGEMGLEVLPDSRFKLPIGARLNYFITDFMVLRGYYRFYWDSWGLIGNTVSLEVPLKIPGAFTVYPYYRFHIQQGADYFKPYMQHDPLGLYHTSDRDLSSLHSHKYGLGLRYSPLYGKLKKNRGNGKLTRLRRVEIRGMHYLRSDGLKAFMVTANIGFDL